MGKAGSSQWPPWAYPCLPVKKQGKRREMRWKREGRKEAEEKREVRRGRERRYAKHHKTGDLILATAV